MRIRQARSVLFRVLGLSVLLQCALLRVEPLAAQDLPVLDPRSAELALATRTLWRSMTLTDAVSANAQLALPLFGSPGLLNGVQLEIRSWNALEDRDRFRYADQYAATARYLHRIGDASRTQYFSIAYTEYLNPLLDPPTTDESKWNGEVGLGVALETGIPSMGVPAIHFYGDLAHEFLRSDATYARIGASHTAGVGSIAGTVALSVSASDYPPGLAQTSAGQKSGRSFRSSRILPQLVVDIELLDRNTSPVSRLVPFGLRDRGRSIIIIRPTDVRAHHPAFRFLDQAPVKRPRRHLPRWLPPDVTSISLPASSLNFTSSHDIQFPT